MPRDNPFRPFTPNPDFLARLPDGHSGNRINGLGETEIRRPHMVWWAPDTDAAPFGDAQKWFYAQETQDAEMADLRARRRAIIEEPLPPLADTAVDRSPEMWTAALDHFVAAGDCEKTGVTALRPEWVYDHHETEFRNVIILAVRHQYEELRHVPALRGGKDVTRQYCRAAAATKKVAGWLREQGWDADPVTGPMTGQILMIPPAIECGMGELGKHGSIINPEFGSGFRLGAVLTNAPFAPTPRQEYGIDGFCQHCRLCEDACPPFAISPEKQTVRGTRKWYVDFDKCIPFFAETSGCAICIAVCPWTRPGLGLNLAEKLARRADRLSSG